MIGPQQITSAKVRTKISLMHQYFLSLQEKVQNNNKQYTASLSLSRQYRGVAVLTQFPEEGV